MQKLIVGSLLAAIAVASYAITAHSQETRSYTDALRVCGAEWKASDARKAVPKGQGRDAWQAFRKECIARTPYQRKREAAKTN